MSNFTSNALRQHRWVRPSAAPHATELRERATPAPPSRDDEPLPEFHSVFDLLARSPEQGPLPGRTAHETDALIGVAGWVKGYLTHPHPALGRPGQVCPYVSASLRQHLCSLTLLRHAATKRREAESNVLRLGEHLLRLEPTAGRNAQLKTIVVLFPDLSDDETPEVINALHRRLKPHFLRNGQMLGEFFKESSKPGLHNPDFRPLRSDTPLLVIRSMVLTDIAFLTDEASFVRAFLENFSSRGCAEVRRYLELHSRSLASEQAAMLLEEIESFEAAPCSSVRPICAHS